MPDVFTSTTTESWFSRIKSSIAGVLFGLLLFGGSFVVLFLNEGRAVTTARSLNEGEQACVSISPDAVSPDNQEKLVHVSGRAETDEQLSDAQFAVTRQGLRLNRLVEMYQWVEEERSESRTRTGGQRETVTTYEYQRQWEASLVNSREFRHPEGHENPATLPIERRSQSATEVRLGAFRLPSELAGKIRRSEPIAVTEENVPDEFRERMQVAGGYLYLGQDPANPQVGDVRVALTLVPNQDVSVIAQQVGNSFAAYQTRAGRKLEFLSEGLVSAAEMFQDQRDANNMLTWVLRLVGAAMMFFGIVLVFRPISVVLDVLPILGNISGFGIALAAGLVTVVGATATIGLAWLFYRPLIGVPLLMVSVGGVVYLIVRARKARAERALADGKLPVPAGGARFDDLDQGLEVRD